MRLNGNGRGRRTHASVLRTQSSNERTKPVLITGGAGFIGTNLAHHFLMTGQPVLILDNLSRPGVEQNLCWLLKEHRGLIEIETADIREPEKVKRAVGNASCVFHLAAQVAVTTSLDDPLIDFEVNALGTLNVLEALRSRISPPPLIFTSTNKVYGAMTDLDLEREEGRYRPRAAEVCNRGISEKRPIDFCSPYGCSKGAADQYVLDYARTFRLPAAVFRMSCIYGPHQFGTEDQGWLAHFIRRAVNDDPITIYGDGSQVRDLLYVDDLVTAFGLGIAGMDRISGYAFNIGGGIENAVSVLEVIQMLEGVHGELSPLSFAEWRTADQRYYVSDFRRFEVATGWKPQTPVGQGIRQLYRWVSGRDNGRSNGRQAQSIDRAGRSVFRQAAGI